jgi:hypothetical protein
MKGHFVTSDRVLHGSLRAWRWCGAVAILAALSASTGCGGGGVKRYDLSGSVTYRGQPVPTGSIVFEPDKTKGNEGPAGFAKIKAGKYDTRQEGGMGIIGGPHLVRIVGLDGKPSGELVQGMPLFPEYSTTVDLPKETGTHDFAVPAGGGSSTSPGAKSKGYSDV